MSLGLFSKTSHRNKLNQCGWSHCVHFAKTQNMICILTLFGHHLTLNSRVLRSYSDLKLSVSTNTCFDGYRRKKNTQWCSNYCSNVPRSKAFHKHIRVLEIVDLTSDDNSWSKVFKIDTIGFVSSRATRSFYLRNSSLIRGWRGSNRTPYYTLDAVKSHERARVNSRPAAAPKHVMHLPG